MAVGVGCQLHGDTQLSSASRRRPPEIYHLQKPLLLMMSHNIMASPVQCNYIFKNSSWYGLGSNIRNITIRWTVSTTLHPYSPQHCTHYTALHCTKPPILHNISPALHCIPTSLDPHYSSALHCTASTTLHRLHCIPTSTLYFTVRCSALQYTSLTSTALHHSLPHVVMLYSALYFNALHQYLTPLHLC